MMQSKRALVIAHEPDEPGGQVAVRLTERGYDVDTHFVTQNHDAPNAAAPFPNAADYDVLAIMGSIHSLTRKQEIESWIYDELELVREAHAADQPVLGICFGGQLIAEALGGSVEVSPVTEIGWYTLQDVSGADNPAGPGPWMEWHHDRFTAPPGATVLAETDSCPQLYSIGRMAGTQFHPEVDVAHIDGWLASAIDEYLTTYGQERAQIRADAAEHEARNIEQCARLVDWFLDTIAFPKIDVTP
ncbi:MAG: GMP synthase-like glutamine amidotransferase [Verrucomicrobiales bacterium]|jgi:GMP synthase-like glutamine amidotransferase